MELRATLVKYNNNSEHKKILTNRELEYLCLVALGYHNSVIAKNLFVTRNTVKKTLEKIFKKLNAKDRANAVAIAFVHNVITPKFMYDFILSHEIIEN
jgi:DNA-binding NarL/FixJ family response regulator